MGEGGFPPSVVACCWSPAARSHHQQIQPSTGRLSTAQAAWGGSEYEAGAVSPVAFQRDVCLLGKTISRAAINGASLWEVSWEKGPNQARRWKSCQRQKAWWVSAMRFVALLSVGLYSPGAGGKAADGF